MSYILVQCASPIVCLGSQLFCNLTTSTRISQQEGHHLGLVPHVGRIARLICIVCCIEAPELRLKGSICAGTSGVGIGDMLHS